MSATYYKIAGKFQRIFAAIVILSILTSLFPISALAEGELPPEDPMVTAPTEEGEEEDASSTESTAPDGETASSTSDGAGGGDGDGASGDDGSSGAEDGETVTTTATTTASTTPPVEEGDEGSVGNEGSDGPDGSEGVDGTAGATPDDEVTPVGVVSDVLIGDNDSPEEEENTGDVRKTGTNTLIETGIATAQGQLYTDANSNDVRSELEDITQTDFDTYTFIATGTNQATVTNDGEIFANSGDNYASGRYTAEINTGDAVAAFNVANIINTNVINSDGFIYLANQIMEENQSLDLTDSFFPDVAEVEALSNTCSLLSCVAEDVVYNVSQMNHATITNDAIIEATTGYNDANGDEGSTITTGDAYGAANIINVVNSNIIDSNYRLLTFNAIGDVGGDLVLPTGELFDAFFSRPNGTNQVEDVEDVQITVDNLNEANIDNNLDAFADTGNNDSTATTDAVIKTGIGESESNILNKINENTYGGDSLYLLIRVHGVWSGDVVGLPAGLAWEWTPMGIVIYNEDAEIAPSEFLGYDIDSYKANFSNNNQVTLQNNITINAITGENEIEGATGVLETGDAFASANVMNIANTNIVGTNWTFGVINILGDFDGNISFKSIDIALSGSVDSIDTPVGPGDTITYTYTVTNNSNSTATNIELEQVMEFARTSTGQTNRTVAVGSLAPGASTEVILSAIVDVDIPYGTTSVTALASIESDQGDGNMIDNLLMLSVEAEHNEPVIPDPDDTGTTTDDDLPDEGAGTTTDPIEEEVITPPVVNTTSGGGGGGGGGGPSSKKKKVEREELKNIDPNKAPLLSIKKTAINVDEDDIVSAGDSIDYKITITNKGGNAYNAQVFDVLTNPIGSVVNEQSWDLGTILPGEVINLTYTTEYAPNTPTGQYTNTARVEAYLKDGMKEAGDDPLKIKDSSYTVQVKGVDLAVGNVSVLAYFPGLNGKTSALVVWETSKPAVSQIFFGLSQLISPYNPNLFNFGYQYASFKFPTIKPKHAMIINNLEPGQSHAYRIHAIGGDYKAISREYTFTVPPAITSLTLAFPTNPATPAVAGAATSTALAR